MKKILFFLTFLIYCNSVYNQCDFVSTETDKFTGLTTTSPNRLFSVYKGDYLFYLYPVKIVDEKKAVHYYLNYIIKYSTSERKCISENSRIILLLSDGSKIDKLNLQKFNCNDGENSGTIELSSIDLKSIKTKTITDVRVYFVEGFVDLLGIDSKDLNLAIECVF